VRSFRFLPTLTLVFGLIACVSSATDIEDSQSKSTIDAPEPWVSSESDLLPITTYTPESSAIPTRIPPTQIIILTETQIGLGITPTQTPAPTIQLQVCSPLEEHSIDELAEIVSAPYDPPPPGKEERHHGVDFSYYRRGERSSIEGVGIQALFPGKVAASLVDTFPYGNLVIIETPAVALPAWILERVELGLDESLYTLYAHLGELPLVSLGEDVESCQLIGYVGLSGNAVEPHLHLEARRGPAGVTFEGMSYYSTQTTEGERANYERWRTGGEFVHFNPMLLLVR